MPNISLVPDKLIACVPACSFDEKVEDSVECVKKIKDQDDYSYKCKRCLCSVMKRRIRRKCPKVIKMVDSKCGKTKIPHILLKRVMYGMARCIMVANFTKCICFPFSV